MLLIDDDSNYADASTAKRHGTRHENSFKMAG